MRNRWMRRGGTAAVALVAALAPSASGSAGPRPRPLTVASGHQAVTASQGSFCVVRHRAGVCADFAYPLQVDEHLSVAPLGTVMLKTHDPSARTIRVSLLHATRESFQESGWSHLARRVPGHPAWRRVHLPSDLGNANRLDVSALYAHHGGDSDWWAGIKVPRA
jgi:hypothetical protein